MRRLPPAYRLLLRITASVGLCAFLSSAAWSSELRRTALVRAVENARPSVVNLRGEKTVTADTPFGTTNEGRRVNGMGTGIVIDPDGYVLTNFHVVDGVRNIEATLYNGRSYSARVLAYDTSTDLAVIKIEGAPRLRMINIGTSSDLMLAEPVIAVGNPFGYEHTVTRGIISALHRTVQVTETLIYEDLIQTDASINPGNSGGPLLNIDGELIGVAVAVRAGAQGIAFAIPVDRALTKAAELLRDRRDNDIWHGLVVRDEHGETTSQIVVKDVETDSPADELGLQRGDVISSVDADSVFRSLDFELSMLRRKAGETVTLSVQRGGETHRMSLELAAKSPTTNAAELTWDVLGLRLAPVSDSAFRRYRTRYRGGLSVSAVRSGSPAQQYGIHAGDVLVGMHIWETVTNENVSYIVNRSDLERIQPIKFYVLRGGRTLVGEMRLSATDR